MAILGLAIITDFFIIFGGVALQSASITPILSWIRFISPMFYGNEGLVQNEVAGLIIAGEPGDYWLDQYGLNEISVMWAAGGLMILSAGFFLITYGCLEYNTRTRFIIL